MKPSNYLIGAILSASALAANAAGAPSYQMRVTAPGVRAPLAVSALTADTTADFGSVPLNSFVTRAFTFRNASDQAVAGVSASITPTAGLSISANSCGTSAAPISVAAGGACQVTLSYGGGTSSSLNGASVQVAGAFASSPSAVALSGTIGTFNVNGIWVNHYSATAPLTPAELAIGTIARGTLADRTYYVRNIGTSGSMQVGFQLSGDTSQFRIIEVYRRSNAGGHGCLSGGAVAMSGLSATPCMTDAGAPNAYVLLRYAPTVIGDHSITITPTTANGSTLPAPITVTGSSQFNPTAAWSTSSTSYVAMTTAYANYNTVTVGSAMDKRITLANVGTHGGQSVGVMLSGDTTHFTLIQVARYAPGGTYGCVGGGVVATDKLSVTPCGADTGAPHVFFDIRYSPKSKGNHTLTLTPITNNGTALPSPLVVSGTGG